MNGNSGPNIKNQVDNLRKLVNSGRESNQNGLTDIIQSLKNDGQEQDFKHEARELAKGLKDLMKNDKKSFSTPTPNITDPSKGPDLPS